MSSIPRVETQSTQTHLRALLVMLLLLTVPRMALGSATLKLSSATVDAPGAAADLCLSLQTGGADIAGTQNDLVWDGNCATLRDESQCFATGTHGKSLLGKLLTNQDFTYRALILSLSDVDPIDSGVLYCCHFIAEADPGSCCNVNITGAGASDSRGNAVGVGGAPGKLCVASGAGTTATPTPTAAVPTEHSASADGCDIAAPVARQQAWWLAVGAGIALALRRHRARS
ncbi:MAG: hypothetical protein ABI629_19635 [bacterium]